MTHSPINVASDLLGVPTVFWAIFVSLLSFGIAASAFVWQVAKHFLDGGRVQVYLNTAIWEPEFMLATNRSGRFAFQAGDAARGVIAGRALELAQLVVENPGKVPITIYSPGLALTGHGKRKHSLVPRMYATGADLGPDQAVTDTVVRLEPYGRVTFLLDYWSFLPGILKDAPTGHVFLRGFVAVAGRSRRPQKSAWRLRWRIRSGAYTSIVDEPAFTPIGVMWREMYARLPERAVGDADRHPKAGPPITRGMLHHILDEAMSQFEERPEPDQLATALDDIAKKYGDHFPLIGTNVYWAYEALGRMAGHLTGWTDGLFRRSVGNQEPAPSREGSTNHASEADIGDPN